MTYSEIASGSILCNGNLIIQVKYIVISSISDSLLELSGESVREQIKYKPNARFYLGDIVYIYSPFCKCYLQQVIKDNFIFKRKAIYNIGIGWVHDKMLLSKSQYNELFA